MMDCCLVSIWFVCYFQKDIDTDKSGPSRNGNDGEVHAQENVMVFAEMVCINDHLAIQKLKLQYDVDQYFYLRFCYRSCFSRWYSLMSGGSPPRRGPLLHRGRFRQAPVQPDALIHLKYAILCTLRSGREPLAPISPCDLGTALGRTPQPSSISGVVSCS
jgi:hypothetical protein